VPIFWRERIWENGNADVLLMSLERFFKFLSSHQQQRFLDMRLSA
jgi:hypothetical protein